MSCWTSPAWRDINSERKETRNSVPLFLLRLKEFYPRAKKGVPGAVFALCGAPPCSNPLIRKTNPGHILRGVRDLVRLKGFEPPTYWFVVLIFPFFIVLQHGAKY